MSGVVKIIFFCRCCFRVVQPVASPALITMPKLVPLVRASLLLLAVRSSHQSNPVVPTLCPQDKQTLKFVTIISRHGSRSPLSTFPTDPYPYTDPKYWPNGPTELSNYGKVQLYNTGEYLRQRYSGFLESIYNPNATEVTYNPYDRDYMSAACLTAGMYPPVGQQIWNPVLKWQPVVQSVRDYDICDLVDGKICPKFKVLSDKEIDKYNEDTPKHEDLLKYVSANTGMNYTKISQMYDLYDTLLMQAQNGYKLPQWTKEVFPFKLRPHAVSYLLLSYSATKELIQLGAGPELKHISNKLNMKANGTYNDQKKFYVEAAHDCTLLSLLKALGNKDQNLEIHTAAYLMFELHEKDGTYIVQVNYFRSPYDQAPESIAIDGCPSPCSLSNFNKFVDSINPPNYKQACQV